MIRPALNWLAGTAQSVRHWQQDALTEMQRLDAAVSQHMAHGAMAGTDPLTESLYDQMQAAAEEGARPHSTSGSGLTPEQLTALADSQADDWWLDALMPAAVLVCIAVWAAKRLGWF